MADAYLATIDPDIVLDWSGSGTRTADGDHRTRYIAALRAADGFDVEPLIEFVGSLKAGAI